MVACSKDSPAAIAEKYMSAIHSEDIDAFKEHIIQARADQDQVFIEISIRKLNQDLTTRYGEDWIRLVKYVEVEADDETAKVHVQINKDSESIQLNLIKEGDQWKVSY